ncbi:prepilin-type N-terminal cleavage/methylation domain-containing protein [Hyphomicrobium facile]|uniref:Type IV pilin N-term methylation site GFxxxE n=1 Tax=Hyphomicrobium facile TaxID=51670 RepID=A0A1I7NQX7_9HYPH|nr:prepilin-type N-terminal cleavage/methylation domain-containing protein [Hyphomicrobium facile]SFV36988.1 Type IV pilin N-term methylation site GFxxxE [Hyphomicrobium facile]
MTSIVREHTRLKPEEAGFTLLEVLVSLVLISLLLAALPHALRITKSAFNVTAKLDQESVTTASLAFLERHLSEAMPIYRNSPDGMLAMVFSGEPRAVKFVAPMISRDQQSGLFLFSLSTVAASNDRQSLALTWQPFRSVSDHRDAPQSEGQRILLADATGFTLSYFGASAHSTKAQWTDKWTKKDALPTLVEFTYKLPDGRSGVRSRRVELHLRPQP